MACPGGTVAVSDDYREMRAPSDNGASVVERERRFFDAKDQAYSRVRGWITRAIGEFNREDEMHRYYDPRGKRVLDYGCGEGRLSFSLAEDGARTVTGFDISEVRVKKAREEAQLRHLRPRMGFLVADAHRMGLRDEMFDLIVGQKILHHLDLEAALRELRRVLRLGGSAVFVEPLWHNPLLRLGRALTPSARTPDEHPLSASDWDLCAQVFSRFQHYEREFITIPLMPLNLVLPREWQRRLARRVGRWDDWLLARFPSLRRHARVSILVLR